MLHSFRLLPGVLFINPMQLGKRYTSIVGQQQPLCGFYFVRTGMMCRASGAICS
jgi:hypothetical protein